LNAFIEETVMEDARALFDTDFWGVVGVNAFFLPAMRARRSGRIVIVGSLAGRVGAIGQGFYSAAKHALEGYAETLAAEVLGFGIAVNIVEPGFHRTELHVHMQRGGRTIADYDGDREAVARAIEQAIAEGADPGHVAAAIERLIESRSAALRHPVGSDARWLPRLKSIVPPSMFMARMRRRFGMK
jgi:NAD(P)-dependent dehydrogenase (short-subunit alcohol dehydrogenase family)